MATSTFAPPADPIGVYRRAIAGDDRDLAVEIDVGRHGSQSVRRNQVSTGCDRQRTGSTVRMTTPLRHGVFLGPFHSVHLNPTITFEELFPHVSDRRPRERSRDAVLSVELVQVLRSQLPSGARLSADLR